MTQQKGNKRVRTPEPVRCSALICVALALTLLFTGCAPKQIHQKPRWPVFKTPTIVQRSPEDVAAEKERRRQAMEEQKQAELEKEAARLAAMPKVSGQYIGNDLQEVLTDFTAQTGVPIVYDFSVEGTVFLELDEVPLEKALEMLLFAGGFEYRLFDGAYYVGSLDPENPSAVYLFETETIRTAFPSGELIERLGEKYKPFVSAGETTSHLLTINAPPRILKKIKSVVNAMSELRQQVIIDVLIVDVSFERSFEVGANWGDFGLTTDGVVDFEHGFKAGYQSTIMGSILTTIQFLWQNGAVDLKANPKVVTLEGKEATVDVSLEQRFAILSGNVSFPQIFIEVVKTGTILKVTPWLLPDDYVMLSVSPEVSDVVGQTKQSSASGGEQTLPIVSRRKVESTLKVKLGETIIIGGLRNTLMRELTAKVPGLGDIPIVNFAFRNQKYMSETKEMMILLTPRLVEGGFSHEDFGNLMEPGPKN